MDGVGVGSIARARRPKKDIAERAATLGGRGPTTEQRPLKQRQRRPGGDDEREGERYSR